MMRHLVLALAVCALGSSASAQEQTQATALPAVSSVRSGDMLLVPGRELVVTWKPGAPPTQVSEKAAGAHGLPPIPSDPNIELWPAPVTSDKLKGVQSGQIGFTLHVEADRGTTLIVTSGQTEPFVYMANMIMKHEGRLIVNPTTICAVRPGAAGIETWPYPVEGVQIVGIGLAPADMCYDHAAKKGYKAGEQPPSVTGQK